MLYLYLVATQPQGGAVAPPPPPPPPEVGGGTRKKKRKPWHGGLVYLEKLRAEPGLEVELPEPNDEEELVLLLYLLD